ncbi:MAG TPA: type II toxin-antitoxin system VapC family toxin [Stellaceae bacterium]|nr:type II toxin-antitoxin system VapC family toxin [Stellaceae bacterium]
MNEGDIVVDASVVIAFLVGEPFTRFDSERIGNALISAVNLAEVLTRLPEIGVPEAETAAAIARVNLRVIAFDEEQAAATAALRPLTRRVGLSLGDRACLALGKARACPVVTADRAWAGLDVGVDVILIR